jgi:hypothetical protein
MNLKKKSRIDRQAKGVHYKSLSNLEIHCFYVRWNIPVEKECGLKQKPVRTG